VRESVRFRRADTARKNPGRNDGKRKERVVRLQQIYETCVATGIANDARSSEEIDRALAIVKRGYDKLDESERQFFDAENYDILSSTGYMRRNGIYVETCTPSSFPVDRGDLPPAGSGCGKPYPPPISRFNAKVHVPGQPALLDSTPLVADLAYCNLIGYTDRAFCPVRMEGSPERVACESWAVGNARDTGRPGPTWTRMPEGTLCTGPASGCANHETNQYALYVYKAGTYRATGRNGAYGEVVVEY
jgi:hypothetical protein